MWCARPLLKSPAPFGWLSKPRLVGPSVAWSLERFHGGMGMRPERHSGARSSQPLPKRLSPQPRRRAGEARASSPSGIPRGRAETSETNDEPPPTREATGDWCPSPILRSKPGHTVIVGTKSVSEGTRIRERGAAQPVQDIRSSRQPAASSGTLVAVSAARLSTI